MNNIKGRKLFLILIVFLLSLGSCNVHLFHRNPEKQLFGKALGKKKQAIVKQPRKVLKARRKQEANDRRLNREYDKSVKRSQKRTIDIQTPEVQARMKQDKKDITIRDKTKRKKVKEGSRRAAKKYN